MGQKIKSMVIQCPHQKREVDVIYKVFGNWFNREYKVLFCPAKKDSGGNCYRQCKSILASPPGLDKWHSGRMLS